MSEILKNGTPVDVGASTGEKVTHTEKVDADNTRSIEIEQGIVEFPLTDPTPNPALAGGAAALIEAWSAIPFPIADRAGARSPELRAERAMGGVVGMDRAAKKARAALADEAKPLMNQPDEHIAEALKIAARYA